MHHPMKAFSMPTPRRLTLAAWVALALAGPVAAQMPGPMPPEVIAAAQRNPRIAAGEAWIVDRTTTLESLTLAPGGSVAGPVGRSLTMTVDGVETTLRPGRYRGTVVLTVAEPYLVDFSPVQKHPLRAALYVDQSGIVAHRSVLAAAGAARWQGGVLSGAHLRSVGENFNGLLATGGRTLVKDLRLDFTGNGGNDFAGYGAGVMSDGPSTYLVLDGARIRTQGAVRTAVVAQGGSHLLVKNSDITALGGTLPADHVSNVTPGEMKDAPWMLGIRGNNRATNLLGTGTVATYLNSRLLADGWGVLSVDASQNSFVTAINSQITLNGPSGYGSYAIGNSTNGFYGSTFDVPTHGVIITGGHAVFGASTPATLARLNTELKLGLSAAELAAVHPAQTVVRSQRYGVMMWGDATVKIGDATLFDTGEAIFLNKGATSRIDIDGSAGAQLKTRNGVIFQAMDNDDPGPVMTDGLMANTGVWREPTGPTPRVAGFALAAEHATDMVMNVRSSTLIGDFYNAIGVRQIGGGFGPDGPSKEPPTPSGANLVLTLTDSHLTGVVTSAQARHLKETITAADAEWLGRVINTPAPAVNNGVILRLQGGSTWTVTGPSHLSRLEIDASARLQAPEGRALKLTVNGVATPVRPGSYQGQILLHPVAR
jgi:hypothetical protein